MKKDVLLKNHVTKGNFLSNYYFELIYFLISNSIDYKNKVVLDFGGFLEFLKKKLIKKGAKIIIYDKVKELSEINDYKTVNFDIIIFCQVLMYIDENEVKKIFDYLNSLDREIIIITCFSQQTLVNKVFGYLLGHPNPHKDTVLFPDRENEIFKKFFIKKKRIKFLFN